MSRYGSGDLTKSSYNVELDPLVAEVFAEVETTGYVESYCAGISQDSQEATKKTFSGPVAIPKRRDNREDISIENSSAYVNRKIHVRSVEIIMSIVAIIVVGVFSAFMLYPKAELSEMSRRNSDLKDDISDLRREIVAQEGANNGITDMDSIRAQAFALGMQEPNANQVVTLPMPNSDRLVSVITYDANGINDEVLSQATNNLVQYYHENSEIQE